MNLLKPACPCGHPRCRAFGTPAKSTGHSRKCWDGCPTCAKPKKAATKGNIPGPVRRQVMTRANGFCEARTNACTGQPEQLHHKRMRSQGGGHTTANLIAICGECHDFIHANPEWASANGLLERTSAEPQSSALLRVTKVER